jgi:hypothetical protein
VIDPRIVVAFGMRSLVLFIGLGVAACSGGAASTPAPNPPTPPTAPASNDAAADVKMICDEAATAANRQAFASVVDSKLASERGKNIFAAAAQAGDADKHATIKQGAAEVGVADWDCLAAFEKLYGAQQKP